MVDIPGICHTVDIDHVHCLGNWILVEVEETEGETKTGGYW